MGLSGAGARVVVVSMTASLMLLKPELIALNPDWKMFRAVVTTSEVAVVGSVARIVVVDDDNVEAAVTTELEVL